MKSITEVRDELAKVFMGLKAGTISPKEAIEINNCAGKIINTVKVELAYHALRHAGSVPVIPFMGNEAAILEGAPAERIEE